MKKVRRVVVKDDRLETIRQRINEAEAGKDGLKRIRWRDFEIIPAHRIDEFLTEPIVLTADGVDKRVVMSLEDYKSVKFTTKARMARIQGVLYREVI